MARLFAALLMLAPLTASAQDATRSINSDWPKWRGPRGDGTWHAPRLAEAWPKSGLKSLWSTPIGGGYAGVIVARGKVLVLDRQTGPVNPKTSKPDPKNEIDNDIEIENEIDHKLGSEFKIRTRKQNQIVPFNFD